MHYLFVAANNNEYAIYLQQLYCLAAKANGKQIVMCKTINELYRLQQPSWVILAPPRKPFWLTNLILILQLKVMYSKGLLSNHLSITPSLILKKSGILIIPALSQAITTQAIFGSQLQNGAIASNFIPPLHKLIADGDAAPTTLPTALYYYTLGITTLQEALLVLKVFSIFKKWQQTNTEIILVIEPPKIRNLITEKLLTYKYRTAVTILATYNPVAHRQAYGTIIFNTTPNRLASLYQSFHYNIPVIVNTVENLNGELGSLVFPTNFLDEKAFATTLVNLYKSETERNKMAETAHNWLLQQTTIEQQVQQLQGILASQ